MTEDESRYMEWLGEMAGICTRRMTGRVCCYCQCEHSAKQAPPDSTDPEMLRKDAA